MWTRVERWWLARPGWAEVPWVATTAVAGVALLLARPAVPWPAGSDWPQYVGGAAWLWAPELGATWPDWRAPAYPFLLGLVPAETFVDAGRQLARASALGVVASAAALARLLAGRAAAAVTALLAAALPLLAVAVHWVNPYPLLAAVSGGALAAGAAAALHPRPLTVSLAGFAAGLAGIVDLRAVPVAAAVALLVLVGAAGARRPALGLGLLAAAPPLLWDSFVRDRYGVPALPFSRQVAWQHELLGELVQRGGIPDAAVQAACTPQALAATGPAAWVGACAEALHAWNLRDLVAHAVLPGPTWALLGLLLLVPPPPGPTRGRLWLTRIVCFGAPAAALELGLRWVVTPDRYVLPYAAPLAAWVPVAAAGLGARAGARGALLGAGLALIAGLLGWPGGADRRTVAENDRTEAERGVVLAWLEGVADDAPAVVDCALVDHALARAPRPSSVRAHRPELPPCRPFSVPAAPPGAVLIVLASRGGPGDLGAVPTETLRASGWTAGPALSESFGIWIAPTPPGAP